MKKLKQILLKERKNKLIEGVVDIPMLFYHKLKGNEQAVMEICKKGIDNEFNGYYKIGEIISAPVTIPLMIAFSLKQAYLFAK